jgi:hypothetical protein
MLSIRKGTAVKISSYFSYFLSLKNIISPQYFFPPEHIKYINLYLSLSLLLLLLQILLLLFKILMQI